MGIMVFVISLAGVKEKRTSLCHWEFFSWTGPGGHAAGCSARISPLYSHKYASKKCKNDSLNMAKKRAH